MIPLNVEQRLGRKAFVLLFVKRIAPFLVSFFVFIVLVIAQGSIVSSLTGGMMSLTGSVPISASPSIASVMVYIMTALFFFTIFLLLFGVIVALLEYRNYAFTLQEFDLMMRKGIIDRKEISLPYRQIQDVAIERNLGHQLLGLSKIVLTTAGHEEETDKGIVEIVLEPIDKDVAQEIRLRLQREIGVQIVETEKEADKEAGVPSAH